ncbi:MAG: hypothetical protein U0103_13110, partial [Candidatus Obscuribacterales bacterium]
RANSNERSNTFKAKPREGIGKRFATTRTAVQSTEKKPYIVALRVKQPRLTLVATPFRSR